MTSEKRKISFPAYSVLAAVVQDGDVRELLKILHNPEDKVNIDQKNHVGLTALHHGVLTNNLDTVKILLSHGAEVNVPDVHGVTSLHTAAACGFLQIVSLLLVFGGDVFSVTREMELPIDLAKDVNIVRLLSQEMTRRLHSEVYLTSFVLRKVCELWIMFKSLVAWIFTVTCRTVTQRWVLWDWDFYFISRAVTKAEKFKNLFCMCHFLMTSTFMCMSIFSNEFCGSN